MMVDTVGSDSKLSAIGIVTKTMLDELQRFQREQLNQSSGDRDGRVPHESEGVMTRCKPCQDYLAFAVIPAGLLVVGGHVWQYDIQWDRHFSRCGLQHTDPAWWAKIQEKVSDGPGARADQEPGSSPANGR